MPQNSNPEDNEIELSELLTALWAHKLLIALVMALSVFLAGDYALKVEKIYRDIRISNSE